MIDINGRNPFAKFTYREVNRKLDNNFGMGLDGSSKRATRLQMVGYAARL